MQPSLGTRNQRRVCPRELPPKEGAGRRLEQNPRLAEVQLGNRGCGDGSRAVESLDLKLVGPINGVGT